MRRLNGEKSLKRLNPYWVVTPAEGTTKPKLLHNIVNTNLLVKRHKSKTVQINRPDN